MKNPRSPSPLHPASKTPRIQTLRRYLWLDSKILTDWYLLRIDRGKPLLDLVDPTPQVATPAGDLGQLGGKAREDVLRDGQEGGELPERAGEGAVRHRIQLGAHRPALGARRHVAAAQVPRLHLPHYERHRGAGGTQPDGSVILLARVGRTRA